VIRYKLTIEYDGTNYSGWQLQQSAPSVQGIIEGALSRLATKGQSRVILHVAGRTDAGVHALAQVAHFDMQREMEPRTLVLALNDLIRPHPIAIKAVEVVGEDFHSRFSARKRRYLYRILNRSARSALDENRVWHVPQKLDLGIMNEAATILLGKHDFSSFRSTFCQAKSAIRTLDELSAEKVGEEIHIQVSARSFLHNQVRIMVSALKLVGQGKWQVADVRAALEAKDRTKCAPTAPACGLYLAEVVY
jgi:tRNA pseudouridine38-40 synthase